MFEDEEGGGYYDYGTGELDNSTLSQLVGNGLDLGSFSPDILNDLRGLNYGSGQGALDLGGYNDLVAAYLLSSPSGDYFGSEDLAEADLMRKMQEYQQLLGGGVQDLGPTTTPTDEEGRLKISGYEEDRLPSQWQTVGKTGLKTATQDDGTAIGMNPETGTAFSLGPAQVQNLVKQGLLNTFNSGYFGATGGSKVAPGGGITTTKDGKTYTLKPDGKLYDTNTGATVRDTKTIKDVFDWIKKTGGTGGVSTQPGGGQNLLGTLLPLLLMAMAARKGGGGASGATIPALTAEQRQTPYRQLQTAAGYRPGQGGIRYFEPMQYAPRMASGGIVDLARLLAAQRMARGGGTERKGLLQGQGDGVSDSIPATIDGERPARLARGEYVVDARTVAELGNGSTDAGAERLDEMRKRIHAKRKKAKVGQDSRAYKDLPA